MFLGVEEVQHYTGIVVLLWYDLNIESRATPKTNNVNFVPNPADSIPTIKYIETRQKAYISKLVSKTIVVIMLVRILLLECIYQCQY